MHLNARRTLEITEFVPDIDRDTLQTRSGVRIIYLSAEWRMEFVPGVFEERVIDRRRELIWDGRADEDSRFVCPAATDILDRVSATAKNKKGDIVFAYEVDAFPVRGDGQVERSEAITSKRIRAALKDNGRWSESSYGIINDRLEQR